MAGLMTPEQSALEAELLALLEDFDGDPHVAADVYSRAEALPKDRRREIVRRLKVEPQGMGVSAALIDDED